MPIVLGGSSEGKDSQNDEELHGQAGLMMVPLMGGFYTASQVGLGDDYHFHLKHVLLIHPDGLLRLYIISWKVNIDIGMKYFLTFFEKHYLEGALDRQL